MTVRRDTLHSFRSTWTVELALVQTPETTELCIIIVLVCRDSAAIEDLTKIELQTNRPSVNTLIAMGEVLRSAEKECVKDSIYMHLCG